MAHGKDCRCPKKLEKAQDEKLAEECAEFEALLEGEKPKKH